MQRWCPQQLFNAASNQYSVCFLKYVCLSMSFGQTKGT
jgi:hypothetical protein